MRDTDIVNQPNQNSGPSIGTVLKGQLAISWSLAEQVLNDLTEDECLWVPSESSWTVRACGPDGRWVADWTEPEPWPAPPTSLAWLLWHTIWWWSMVIDYSFRDGTLQRDDVAWPGAEGSLSALRQLHQEWTTLIGELPDDEINSSERTRWPYSDSRPFSHVVGWVNIELMKNIAEMSLARRFTPHFAGGRFHNVG